MGEIAPEEQFLPLSTIFYYLMLDFYVKTGIILSLRDKRLFEITEVEITRVNCILHQAHSFKKKVLHGVKVLSNLWSRCSLKWIVKIRKSPYNDL